MFVNLILAKQILCKTRMVFSMIFFFFFFFFNEGRVLFWQYRQKLIEAILEYLLGVAEAGRSNMSSFFLFL
jgi:hypothetical protein